MTPMRAKRNSKAPERFSSDEPKVDTSSTFANHKQGDKLDSAMRKSNMMTAREPLKVKLPKLKRPQSIPQQIKVKISRHNRTGKDVAEGPNPGAKIKLSLERPKKSGSSISKTNHNPLSLLRNVDRESETSSQYGSNKTGDLMMMSAEPICSISDKSFSFADSPSDTKHDNGLDESYISNDDANDQKSSPSSRNSESPTMQIIVERQNELNNSGIRCPCGVEDDIGVMVECEKCSTWQHGHCINVCSEEDAYEGYVCGYCLYPAGKQTDSLQQLTVGDKYQAKFDKLELLMRKKSDKTSSNLDETDDENRVDFSLDELELSVGDLRRVTNSLKVKWKLLNNDDYAAELKVWRNPIWSDDPVENNKQKQRQTVSFVGDIYKSNLRLHLSNLLSNMQKRCQLIRYQIMETHAAPDSRLDNLLMVLDEISRVVENYSDEMRQN